MAGKESNFLNMTLTLLVVTLVASAALGYVYQITKAPIAKAKLEKKIKAISEVTHDFDNNPVNEALKFAVDTDSLEMYPAKMGGKITSYAIRTISHKGYSGDIVIMVGFDTQGKIINTAVVEHKETPGLGSKMSEAKFSNQFIDLDPESSTVKVTKDKGEIDAITAATISSRAFCDAVNKAHEIFKRELNNGSEKELQ